MDGGINRKRSTEEKEYAAGATTRDLETDLVGLIALAPIKKGREGANFILEKASLEVAKVGKVLFSLSPLQFTIYFCFGVFNLAYCFCYHSVSLVF